MNNLKYGTCYAHARKITQICVEHVMNMQITWQMLTWIQDPATQRPPRSRRRGPGRRPPGPCPGPTGNLATGTNRPCTASSPCREPAGPRRCCSFSQVFNVLNIKHVQIIFSSFSCAKNDFMFAHVRSCSACSQLVQGMFTRPEHAKHAIDCKNGKYFSDHVSFRHFMLRHVQRVHNRN